MRPFKGNHFPAWFYHSIECFLLPKCAFFTNGVYHDLHHNIMFLWFLENSVGKNIHTLPRCGLIFPSQMPYFLHWLWSGALPTQLKPLKPQNKLQKSQGCCPGAPAGASRPGHCEPVFWKNDLPANLFLLCIIPQKRNEFTLAFEYVLYKHTFWHVFQKLGHVWVSDISWYVLGSMSLTCLPIFVRQ